MGYVYYVIYGDACMMYVTINMRCSEKQCVTYTLSWTGERKGFLNWKQRSDIILGIARGLAHLHGEFHIKIIHRDIKSCNILLDDEYQPKIADFGLARFHPEDDTHVSTRFAGTM